MKGKVSDKRIPGPVLCCLVIFFFARTLHSNAQIGQINYQRRNVRLSVAIEAIDRQTGYSPVFVPGSPDSSLTINVNLKNATPGQAYAACFLHTGWGYTISARTKTVFIKAVDLPERNIAGRQEVTVRITDQNLAPLYKATVQSGQAGRNVLSDANGRARLLMPEKGDTLHVSFMGYLSSDQFVRPGREIQIALRLKSTELDQQMVIGYGSTTQRTSTGNITMIGSRQIEMAPVSDPLAALEGQAPGLEINLANGLPGAGFTVRIRGQNSLAQGTQPFYVIDGVPFDNGSLSNIVSGLAAGTLSPFSCFAPQDIESVSVLKDADATAIYGSRGANGVILITTKKGIVGKPRLHASVFYGFSRATILPRLMNTAEYVRMRDEAFYNDTLSPDLQTAPDLVGWDTTRYTDIGKLLTGGMAHTVDAALSLPGGDTHTRYLVSGTYHAATTVFPGDFGEQRVSILGDLFHSSRDERLTIQLSELAVNDHNNQLINDLTHYRTLAPNAPSLTGPDGRLVWQGSGVSFANPLGSLLNHYGATTDNVLVHALLSCQLLHSWSVQVSTGYNFIQAAEESRAPIAGQDPNSLPTGKAYTSNTGLKNWIVEPQTDYADTAGKGILNLMTGITLQARHESVATLTGTGFTSDALLDHMDAAAHIAATNPSTDYRYGAFFGRVNYQWDKTYLLNISLRRDGSSRFGSGKQFGTFGAAGFGWIFSNKLFLSGWPFFSYGKIRLSYGVTGNDQIGDYKYAETWASTTTQPYQGMTGFYLTGLNNPEIAWETIRKLEAALELGFLRDRILFNIAWYRNRSTNQLIPDALPFQTGFTTVLRNVPAIVQNAGLELSLQSHNITGRKLSWTTSANLSLSRNKLIAFPDLAGSYFAGQLVVGQSIHVQKGYSNTGVDPAAGVFRFRGDQSPGGPGLGIIGSPDINCYGGISNSIRVGRWQVDFLLEGKAQTGSNALTAFYNANVPGTAESDLYSNEPVRLLQRWQQPGDRAVYEKFTSWTGSAAGQAASSYTVSQATLANASYIRLKNLSLAWGLPASILRRLYLSKGAVFCRAENLFTFTGYKGADPETQNPFTLPPLRTIVAGFELILK